MDVKSHITMISGSNFGETDGPVLHFLSVFENLKVIHPSTEAFGHYRSGKPPSSTQFNFISTPSLACFSSLIYQFRLFFALFRARKINPQVIYYIRSHYLMISPLILAYFYNIPCIVEFNGIIDVNKGQRSWWALKIGKFVEKLLAKRSSAVITITQEVKTWLARNYDIEPQHIHVLPNGADPDRFPPTPVKELRDQLKLNPSKTIITYVGTLSWWQGLTYFIESAQSVIEKQKDILFLIVGDGPERKELEFKVNEWGLSSVFIFTGEAAAPLAASYMCASDICVLPKIPPHSGSPIKIFEYMAAGKPVLASDLPGLEIIKETECGILFPAKNTEALTKSLLQLLSLTPEERQIMGDKGRQKFLKDHTWKKISEKTYEIMRHAFPSYKFN